MSRYAYNLKPFGSSQKDFYGKAIVIVTRDNQLSEMEVTWWLEGSLKPL